MTIGGETLLSDRFGNAIGAASDPRAPRLFCPRCLAYGTRPLGVVFPLPAAPNKGFLTQISAKKGSKELLGKPRPKVSVC